MKLRKLTIHNMASIGDATIDFCADPLAESEVFLISGKTGAGKSTILDCICLPLYSTAPRFKNTHITGSTTDGKGNDNINVSDPRQILRRNTGEGFAELEFKGNNGVMYRAKWGVQRSRKKIDGKLQKKIWTLENIDKGFVLSKDAEIQQEIATAVGLDFNQFCRTVMLAQGEFTRFLNSNDNDKSEILSKITGTGIYSKIGVKIFERYKSEENIFNTLKTRIEGITILSDEEISRKKTIVSEIEKENGDLHNLLKSESELLNLLKSAKETENEIKSLDHRILDLKDKALSLLASRHKAAIEISDIEKEMANILLSIEKESDCKEIFNDSPQIIINAKRILSLKDNIATEKNYISARNEEVINVIIPKKSAIENRINEIALKIKDSEKEHETKYRELEALTLPDLRTSKERLMSERIELQNLMIIIQNYRDIDKRVNQEKENLEKQTKHLEELHNKKKQLKEPLTFAEEKLRICKNIYDKLFASSEKILGSIRNSLNVGDICPVCRKEITSAIPSDSAIRSIIIEHKQDLDKAENERNVLDNKMKDTIAEIKTLTHVIELAHKKITEDDSLSKAHDKVIEKCSKLGIQEITDNIDYLIQTRADELSARMNVITEKISSGEEIEKSVRSLEKELRKLSDSLQTEKDSLKKIDLRVETLKTQNIGSEENIKRFDKECAILIDRISRNLNGSKYETGFLKDIADFCKILEKDARRYSELIRENDRLEKALVSRRSALDTLNNTIELIESRMPLITEETDIHPLKTDNLQKYATDLSAEIVSTFELLNNNKKKLDSTRDNLEKIAKSKETETSSEEEIISEITTAARISRINDAIRENDIRSGAITAELKLDEDQKMRLESMIKEYDKQSKILEKWHILNDMFGDSEGKKFRKIAQSYILSELIRTANHYMKTLSERYRLHVEPGTFVILVEDAWQGFARRSASTISGGESFLVSLSLALALSDMGSSFSVDTLFIDEGFGALSGDVLHNAINTLQILHSKAGRKVGIISHVEELRERIPVQINVIRQGFSAESHISITQMI